MKKAILAVFLISFLQNVYCQEYWIHKPSPTIRWLTRIQFVDSLYGWAGGDSGTVIHTTNGGDDWVLQNTGVISFPLDDLFFLNRNYGWAVLNDYFSFKPMILKTTNGGFSWQVIQFQDTTQYVSAIYFLDSLTGFLGGFNGQIYKTLNGGFNWTESKIDSNLCQWYQFPKFNFNFFNQQTGFACGGFYDLQGVVWKTTDSGMNWNSFCVTPEPLKRILAISPNRVYATGGDHEFGPNTLQTYDSGNIWIYDFLNMFGEGRAIAYRTPSELWLPLAYGQTWALSLDSGSSTGEWQVIPCPDSTSVYDAVFKSPTFGWACGTSGALLRYNTNIIGIAVVGNNIPKENNLFQNYPNPFNPVTTISYVIAKTSFVIIKVYNIQGKEINTYIEGSKQSGYHEFKFSSESLASGVYFYKITAGSFTQARKMVIIK